MNSLRDLANILDRVSTRFQIAALAVPIILIFATSKTL